MKNLDNILCKERDNKDNIYLYDRGDKWVAYERSAFHFASTFNVEQVSSYDIESANDNSEEISTEYDEIISARIDDELNFLTPDVPGSVESVEVSDDQIEIHCNTKFNGFGLWRQTIGVLFAKKTSCYSKIYKTIGWTVVVATCYFIVYTIYLVITKHY